MTSQLTSDIAHKQPERDAIDASLAAYLSQGKMIEILGNSPTRDYTNFNNSKCKGGNDGR